MNDYVTLYEIETQNPNGLWERTKKIPTNHFFSSMFKAQQWALKNYPNGNWRMVSNSLSLSQYEKLQQKHNFQWIN